MRCTCCRSHSSAPRLAPIPGITVLYTPDIYHPPHRQATLALLGSLLCQDSVVQWVANHKRHHRHVDIVDRDPHTPWQFGESRFAVFTVGLWWASMGWKFGRVLSSKRFYAYRKCTLRLGEAKLADSN